MSEEDRRRFAAIGGYRQFDKNARRLHADETQEIIIKAMSGRLSNRELAMIGFSNATKRAIIRLIELSPASEEAILNIADLCYADGADSLSGHRL